MPKTWTTVSRLWDEDRQNNNGSRTILRSSNPKPLCYWSLASGERPNRPNCGSHHPTFLLTSTFAMSFFQEASGISIRQGTFNAVEGNQTNNIYSHSVVEGWRKKQGIYDEFPDIRRGLVYRMKDVDHGDCIISWNFVLQKYETVERTISTAKIHGDSSGSRFTVASYKGQNAQKA
ncbi:hypothetical protein E1B28_005185, partial [Marasmius oreades]